MSIVFSPNPASAEEAALLLSAIVDSSDDAIISKNLDGIITSWNRSAERLFGYQSIEAIGQSIATLLIPMDRQEEELDILARLRRGERVDHFETKRKRRDGSLLDLSLTISPVRNASGEIIGASKIARDITEAKLSERAHLLLSAIVDSSDDAIISKDLEGVITSWNKSAQRLFGYTAEEAIGQSIATLLVPMDRQQEEPEILAKLRRGERVDHFETKRKRKDGRLLDISLTISPIRSPSGKIIGASKIARDVTEQIQTQQALREANDKAEAANRAKSQFLATMSHEIRTPMNGIIGMTELVLDTNLAPDQRDYLTSVRISADSLLKVIDDILDFSKMEAGKMEIENVRFDLRGHLEEIIKAMAVQARGKGLSLVLAMDPAVPTMVLGDPIRLRQIIVNLVGNAIKFTDRGKVTLDVSLDGWSGDRMNLCFVVEDSGIGIPVEKQALIFEAFSQEDNSTTRRYGGTGLGLAISMNLVKAMHGRLWVDSEVGKGSRFHFTIGLEPG